MTIPLLMNLGFAGGDGGGGVTPAATVATYPGFQAVLIHHTLHLLAWLAVWRG